MDKIVVQVDENIVIVYLKKTPHISGSGDSYLEALGMMVFNWPDHFNVKL